MPESSVSAASPIQAVGMAKEMQVSCQDGKTAFLGLVDRIQSGDGRLLMEDQRLIILAGRYVAEGHGIGEAFELALKQPKPPTIRGKQTPQYTARRKRYAALLQKSYRLLPDTPELVSHTSRCAAIAQALRKIRSAQNYKTPMPTGAYCQPLVRALELGLYTSSPDGVRNVLSLLDNKNDY